MDAINLISRDRYWRLLGSGALRIVGLSLGVSLLCPPAFAQLSYGRILGAVTDQTGGAIVGTTVTVTDTARGVTRTLMTDSAGEYNAPSLLPSTYTVRAEMKGFRTLDRENVVVGVGQDVRVDVTLQPGEQTQTITVTESIPVVNTTSAELGGTLDNQMFSEIPLTGRLYTKLLEFIPGMAARPGGQTPTFSSNGSLVVGNDWMLDGVSALNVFDSGGPLVGVNSGVDNLGVLPLDSIQEVNVVQIPRAEYGWLPGAQINVGLKSGTNSIHGTANAAGRTDALEARNPFLDPASPKQTDQLEQFGASIGGAIKKDKLFYFAAYEGELFNIGSAIFNTIPTTSLLGGDTTNSIPDAIADISANGATLSPLSLALAGCNATGTSCDPTKGLFGNGQNAGQGGANVTQHFLATGRSDNGIGKLDYHLNDHNTFNIEYFRTNAYSDSPDGAQSYWEDYNLNVVDLLRGGWVWTPNSNWLNQFRASWDRTRNLNAMAECEQPNVAQFAPPNYKTLFGFVSGAAGQPPDDCGFPLVNIDPSFVLGAGNGSVEPSGTWEIVNSTSYTHGKHAFKFGGEFHRDNFSGTSSFPATSHVTDITGVVNFGGGTNDVFPGATGLEDFLTGVNTGGNILIGSPAVHFYTRRPALFAEDDYRITKNIIVNFGLRWEWEPAIAEQNNAWGNFDPTAPTGLVQQQNGKALYRSSWKNFAPSFGVAWDVTGKGTTVIRAGGNILYNTVLALNSYLSYPFGAGLGRIPTGWALYDANGNKLNSPGNIQVGDVNLLPGQINWAQNTPVFNTSTSALVCANGLTAVTVLGVQEFPSPCFISAKDRNYRAPYTTSWTLSFEHAFTNDMSVTVAYVGNHVTDMTHTRDINQPAPGANSAPGIPGSLLEQQRRPYYSQFPYLGTIYNMENGVVSNYEGLQARLVSRSSHGLSYTVKYTFAHALTMADGAASSPMDSRNAQVDYGPSTATPFQDFGVAATYAIPGRKSPGQLLEGWEINTTIAALGRKPVATLDTSRDLSGTGEKRDRWTLVGPAHDFKPVGALLTVPCFGGAGSSFVRAGCSLGLPQACITAANGEATNPSVPGSSGLASLNKLGCYMQGSAVIVPPAQGTFGTMSPNALTVVPFREWDLSVAKMWKFTERYSAQFRAEFFNVINAREYGGIFSNISNPATFGLARGTPGVVGSSFNNPISGSGGPRQVQLALKLAF